MWARSGKRMCPAGPPPRAARRACSPSVARASSRSFRPVASASTKTSSRKAPSAWRCMPAWVTGWARRFLKTYLGRLLRKHIRPDRFPASGVRGGDDGSVRNLGFVGRGVGGGQNPGVLEREVTGGRIHGRSEVSQFQGPKILKQLGRSAALAVFHMVESEEQRLGRGRRFLVPRGGSVAHFVEILGCTEADRAGYTMPDGDQGGVPSALGLSGDGDGIPFQGLVVDEKLAPIFLWPPLIQVTKELDQTILDAIGPADREVFGRSALDESETEILEAFRIAIRRARFGSRNSGDVGQADCVVPEIGGERTKPRAPCGARAIGTRKKKKQLMAIRGQIG